MEAANAAVQKYFVDDLSELIDAMDFGFHTCFSRTLLMYNSTLDCLQRSLVGKYGMAIKVAPLRCAGRSGAQRRLLFFNDPTSKLNSARSVTPVELSLQEAKKE